MTVRRVMLIPCMGTCLWCIDYPYCYDHCYVTIAISPDQLWQCNSQTELSLFVVVDKLFLSTATITATHATITGHVWLTLWCWAWSSSMTELSRRHQKMMPWSMTSENPGEWLTASCGLCLGMPQGIMHSEWVKKGDVDTIYGYMTVMHWFKKGDVDTIYGHMSVMHWFKNGDVDTIYGHMSVMHWFRRVMLIPYMGTCLSCIDFEGWCWYHIWAHVCHALIKNADVVTLYGCMSVMHWLRMVMLLPYMGACL